MSTVFLGHTGQRLAFDPSAISTVPALRAFVAEHGIQTRNQILLTAQGKQVRTQTLLTEHELFVFDSSLLNTKPTTDGHDESTAQLSSPGLMLPDEGDFDPGPAPDTIADQNDLGAWQALFHARRGWATSLLKSCETRSRMAEQCIDEQGVIERSLGVAVASLHQHIKSAEQKYVAAQAWSDEALQNLDYHATSWEANLDSLRSITARAEFMRFFRPSERTSRRLSQQNSTTTLQGFVDVAEVTKSADAVKSIKNSFSQRLAKMQDDLSSARKDGDELLNAVDQFTARSTANASSEPAQLLDEVQMVVKKMASDLEHVQSLPWNTQSISQASKMALLHTRNYLPNLSDFCAEMNELVRRTRQQRKLAAETALEHMRTVSAIESVLAELYQDIKGMEVPQNEDRLVASLNVVARLPSVYGALLVEAVRREEWVAKMKKDCETLQEEIATYQYEEDKRRTKWIQSVQDVCSPELLNSRVLGVELSLQNEGTSWPNVTRNELHDYAKTLRDVYGECGVTQEMDGAIKDLDKPTRRQLRQARAFKNGSVHEAFDDASLLLRGDDQHRMLRGVNSRLEEELRGQKSRVRKLEDLLHRQSHVARHNTGDVFTPQIVSTISRYATPPPSSTAQISDDASRDASVRLPRSPSATKDLEEKKLARRIIDLEAELRAAKGELESRKISDTEAQKQIEEAVSMKKDLMENMEAQQKEFADERRGLEKELVDARERVEELENDIEKMVGSRDYERAGIDARVVDFEKRIAMLTNEVSEYTSRAAADKAARDSLEKRLELAEAAKVSAETTILKTQAEIEQKRDADAEQLQILVAAHAHLSSSAEIPGNIPDMTIALEDLARKSAAHMKDLAEAVAFAKSENESLSSSNERQKTELAAAADRQAQSEESCRQLQERLSAEEAKTEALRQQLLEEQDHLRILRLKFADGETGSEVLRQRVAEEESKAGKLFSQLAEARSHINSLDVELMRLQKIQNATQNLNDEATERLNRRAEHAKDISQRLVAQISRLSRLLERLGLAVSYEDGEMIVERASKLAASAAGMPDSRPLLDRIASLTSPSPTRGSSYIDEPPDLTILRWAEAASIEAEARQFEAYLQQISRFNIDTFSDAVVKRLRDFEYTAKKYNKEAKESGKRAEAYKDRSLKLKNESHAKLAVRDFKEGDLALFLPTRGQAKGAWAAFNINCPHYFLAEKEGMRLGTRDFIVARITKIEQKVVDLSKTASMLDRRNSAIDDASDAASFADNHDNPFDLSDGLMWWLVHANEERSSAGGAPTTPGLGKSTVAAANVDAKGSIRIKRSSKNDDASRHLNKSLESRRSSSASKKGVVGAVVPTLANASANASPIVATFADASSAASSPQPRPRGASLLDPRPSPTNTGSLGANTSAHGVGMSVNPDLALSSRDEPQIQTRDSTDQTEHGLPASRPITQPAAVVMQQQQHRQLGPRTRSPSPSRSVRSLQRHLENRTGQIAPSAKTPSPNKSRGQERSQHQQHAWESLWHTQFSIESPSKK